MPDVEDIKQQVLEWSGMDEAELEDLLRIVCTPRTQWQTPEERTIALQLRRKLFAVRKGDKLYMKEYAIRNPES